MRLRLGSAFLFTLMATAASAGLHRGNGGIEWYTNYSEARAEARATGKPLLIEFRCVP